MATAVRRTNEAGRSPGANQDLRVNNVTKATTLSVGRSHRKLRPSARHEATIPVIIITTGAIVPDGGDDDGRGAAVD